MSVLDQFLKPEQEPGSTHPLIRSWGWLLSHRRGEAHCRVDRRREGLTYAPTKLWLELDLDSGEPRAEGTDWDPELNRWLIEQKVKAIDIENESTRFLLVLRESLQKTEVRLGDGYFSAMFIDVLKKTGLASEPPIPQIMTKIGEYSPHVGKSYHSSFETIKAALSNCAHDLHHLGYGNESVLDILIKAIARYLDDRFSVTNGEFLGLR